MDSGRAWIALAILTLLAVGGSLLYEASVTLSVSVVLPVVVLGGIDAWQQRMLRREFGRSAVGKELRMGRVVAIGFLKLPLLALVCVGGIVYFSLTPVGYLVGVSVFYLTYIMVKWRQGFGLER